MDITGESVLARKKFTENFALDYSYFVDKVSGASVDVLSQASVIKDERKQNSVTATFVHDKTTYTLSFSNSIERDYISNTPHASLEPGHVRRLTTMTLGFGRTRDKVGENNGTAFVPNVAWLGHAESRSYELGLSQILTRNWITSLNSTSSPTTAIGESLSVDSLSRSHGRQGLLARQPDLSGHAHEHRGGAAH
jgi:hypothetical protein